jgi:predicted phage-related endonuclease
MNLQIYDCEQGTPEWYAARAGIPTASEFATVMGKGRGGGESKTRRTYMLKLIGERLTGQPMESYTNTHMERGKAMEAEARDLYAMVRGVEPQQVGFMRRGNAGASPDSLIGADGLVEIKTKLAHLQIEVLLANRLPPEHVAQVQGQLWISGRQWVDFVSYWPGLPLFVTRVQRDETYIATIAAEVDEFLAEMAAITNQVENYRITA